MDGCSSEMESHSPVAIRCLEGGGIICYIVLPTDSFTVFSKAICSLDGV